MKMIRGTSSIVSTMTLNKALALIAANREAARGNPVFLVCGFQPLHLETFLKASRIERQPQHAAEVLTGLYGDFLGNLGRAAESAATSAAVVVEWSDIDPRLGLRAGAGWGRAAQEDIAIRARRWFGQAAAAMRKLAERMPAAWCGPTLPLAPLDNTIRAQAGPLELELRSQAADFLRGLAGISGARVVGSGGESSGGLDPKMELMAGFPYTLPHAAALAQNLAEVLGRRPQERPHHGFDQTLWAGIAGEIGWGCRVVESGASYPGPWIVSADAGQSGGWGSLVGGGLKNEPAVVEAALARQDLRCDARTLFPVLAGWGTNRNPWPKFCAFGNVGAGSVVFVDDNRMELSEVQQAYPEIACLRFPATTPRRVGSSWPPARPVREARADGRGWLAPGEHSGIGGDSRPRGRSRFGGVPAGARGENHTRLPRHRRRQAGAGAHQQDQPVQSERPAFSGGRMAAPARTAGYAGACGESMRTSSGRWARSRSWWRNGLRRGRRADGA